MTAQTARVKLLNGQRIRLTVGHGLDDPVLVLWHEDGSIMSEAVAGWSAGVVEPVCAVGSDFLIGYLEDAVRLEVAEPEVVR